MDLDISKEQNQISAVDALSHIYPALNDKIDIKDNVLKNLLYVTEDLLKTINKNQLTLSSESVVNSPGLSRKFYRQSIKISTENIIGKVATFIAYIIYKILQAIDKFCKWITGSGDSTNNDKDHYKKERQKNEKHKKDMEEAQKNWKETKDKIKQKQDENDKNNAEYDKKKNHLLDTSKQKGQKLVDSLSKEHYFLVASPIFDNSQFNPIGEDYGKYIADHNESVLKCVASTVGFLQAFSDLKNEIAIDKIKDLSKGDINHQLQSINKFNETAIAHSRALTASVFYNPNTKINIDKEIKLLEATERYTLDPNNGITIKQAPSIDEVVEVKYPVITLEDVKVKPTSGEIKLILPQGMWKPDEPCDRETYMKPIEKMSELVDKGKAETTRRLLALKAYKSKLEEINKQLEEMSKTELENKATSLLNIYKQHIQNAGGAIFKFIELNASQIRSYDSIRHLLKMTYDYYNADCDHMDFINITLKQAESENGKNT